MDDCSTGADSVLEAIGLLEKVQNLLRGAGFELGKWRSNSEEVLRYFGAVNENSEIIFAAGDGTTILGIKWLIDEDKFTFQVKNPIIGGEITKRKIVSYVAQLYDPNGYKSPVIVRGKILIQELWKCKKGWDEKLPEEIIDRWNEFWTDIINVERFKIHRWIGTNSTASVQIHGFSDRSEAALGAQIYVRVIQQDGKIICNLLTSKTKVTPLKTVTIPRLELSAAEMLARLLCEIKKSMEWENVEYIFWTDSSITLHWIRKSPNELKTYVANRVASIQNKTEIDCWRHIDTKSNPADLSSREMTAEELVDNRLWLHGPEWLLLPESEWPVSKFSVEQNKETLMEQKVFSITPFSPAMTIRLEKSNDLVPLLDYSRSLEKAVNILSFVIRFV